LMPRRQFLPAIPCPLLGDLSREQKSREGNRDATRPTKTPESTHEKAKQAKSRFTT
jgi:hypothetical protein